MTSRTSITVKSESGAVFKLKRTVDLVPAQPRGAKAQQLKPIRYELESGEPVEEIGVNKWRHPISGEELHL
ncbi:Uncharacterised protein [Comamonas aquatica]|jgi:hypothetical protein|uniref:Uncharacterized protein n=1 Tax=Comamonas aquatica TaxID=225991 RepID=A0AA35GHC5_9BURK|nr:Uncharacterised protein [Comamonas aquatica]CAC9686037.1 Uncharacterised protein [Comamonas aquatica]